jgi:hypothetical protein
MNIEEIEILSVYDVSDPHPWFEMSLDSENLSIDYANYGGFEIGVVDHVVPISQIVGLAETSNEEVVILVNLDNSLSVVEKSKQPLECLAHLGWYTKENDTLKLLKFVDGYNS